MNLIEAPTQTANVQVFASLQLPQEVWTQDELDANLWHGPHGVIVNTSALEQRKAFFEIITRR